ncbi:phosphate signaling complex protein PhoU [Corynebacterium uterequi]|uniref:Phosphate-specific transport system accessory protein PhoU n=1 Tax=Corynebacterium uterequi TaxID=1072256 RepID=A0A0G3HIN8_9CORY|nr:phosphate signaling complex protein PhoU [Corynebacterium uterequi]AKK11803.1 phosphate transport system regulatory protein PhoU [Corynebacterium uterequi]
MRTAYRSSLDDFSHDLVSMCEYASRAMEKASAALLRGSLQKAEEALSMADHLEELRLRCEERAVQLLALQAPVASELRQVISSIYIVEDLDRMGALSMHIGRTARRRHPASAVPEQLRPQFVELTSLLKEMSQKVLTLLANPDADLALELYRDDDAVDAINAEVLNTLTQQDWDGSTREAVEAALLLRYFERWADHCVNVSGRVYFFTSGLTPEQNADATPLRRDEDAIRRRFDDMQRTFTRDYYPGRGQSRS